MSPHLCLGAQLARMEIKVLFEELLPKLSDDQLDGPVDRLRSNFIAGMKRLPVTVSLRVKLTPRGRTRRPRAGDPSCIFDQTSTGGGTMRRTSAVAALAALALIAAACGGDDETESTDAPSATEAPGATEAPVASGDCTLDAPLKIGYAADLRPRCDRRPARLEGGAVRGRHHQRRRRSRWSADRVPDQETARPARSRRHPACRPGTARRRCRHPHRPAVRRHRRPLARRSPGTVPILFMTCTDPTFSDPAQGAFLVSFNDRVQASAAAEFATQSYTSAVTLSASDVRTSPAPPILHRRLHRWRRHGRRVPPTTSPTATSPPR